MDRAYESIIYVINDRTEKKGYDTIDFYEAVRIAYTESKCLRKQFLISDKRYYRNRQRIHASMGVHIYSMKKKNVLKL